MGRGRQGPRGVPGRSGASSLGPNPAIRKNNANKQRFMQQVYPTGKNILSGDLKKKQQQARSNSPDS